MNRSSVDFDGLDDLRLDIENEGAGPAIRGAAVLVFKPDLDNDRSPDGGRSLYHCMAVGRLTEGDEDQGTAGELSVLQGVTPIQQCSLDLRFSNGNRHR